MIFHIFRTPTDYSNTLCGAELKTTELAYTTPELARKGAEENSILKPCSFCLTAACPC
jgi:hypothetical protein